MTTKQLLFEIKAHTYGQYILDLDYYEDSDLLVSGSDDKSIAFIRLKQKKILKKYDNFSNGVFGIKFIWFFMNIRLNLNIF